MASSSSSKGKGSGSGSYAVNASSMLSLLSEVSRHSHGHKRGTISRNNNNANNDEPVAKRAKKSSIFDRSNRGIAARSAKDTSHMLAREDLSVEARRILESREKLEKKALLYEKLARGETVNGVTREQLKEGLLVDFETKAVEESYKDRSGKFDDTDSESDEDEDESKTVPKKGKEPEEEGDELVETTDDLGRTRWVRRSQLAAEPTERVSVMDGGVPLFSNDIKLASSSWHPADNQHTYYGDQHEFHVYEPSAEELEARRKRLNLDIPLNKHFDGSAEIRNRGAGFIQLSADEEERKKQMEELKMEREETERKREQASKEGGAAEKREKELEERRRLIEEKKQKILERRKAAATQQQQASSESKAET